MFYFKKLTTLFTHCFSLHEKSVQQGDLDGLL